MKKKIILRLISMIMLIIAIVFVAVALSNPQFGRVIHIGNFTFGAETWRICYAIYALIMVGFFVISFFIKEKE